MGAKVDYAIAFIWGSAATVWIFVCSTFIADELAFFDWFNKWQTLIAGFVGGGFAAIAGRWALHAARMPLVESEKRRQHDEVLARAKYFLTVARLVLALARGATEAWERFPWVASPIPFRQWFMDGGGEVVAQIRAATEYSRKILEMVINAGEPDIEIYLSAQALGIEVSHMLEKTERMSDSAVPFATDRAISLKRSIAHSGNKIIALAINVGSRVHTELQLTADDRIATVLKQAMMTIDVALAEIQSAGFEAFIQRFRDGDAR